MLNMIEDTVIETEYDKMSAAEKQHAWDIYLRDELVKTKTRAENSNAKRHTWEEFRMIINEKHGI